MYITYSTYKSLVIQRTLLGEYRNPVYYNFDMLDSILPVIPNTTITAMPLDVFKVSYLLNEGRIEETYQYIKNANKINPYTHVGDYLYGKVFLSKGNIDSAYHYSRKAFLGWPKNLDHYNSYLEVLTAKKDTTSLIEAYNFLDEKLRKDPNYFKSFYKTFNDIKLSFLITDYPDSQTPKASDIIGKWVRVYNFPNNQTVKDSTITYDFKSEGIFYNSDNNQFSYKIKSDSLYFYFSSNLSSPISTCKIKFSKEYQTLIFENLPVEKNLYQTQYFKKY